MKERKKYKLLDKVYTYRYDIYNKYNDSHNKMLYYGIITAINEDIYGNMYYVGGQWYNEKIISKKLLFNK